jgi:pimeloyl-ACP methyl ester carboxylesterase
MNQRNLRSEPTDRGPTLFMVPGLDGTALMFYRQIPLLAKRFHVVALPHPNEPDLDMADLVEDLRRLIDERGKGPIFLCGESFGGALALSFALAHSDYLAGLVIVNSFAYLKRRWRLWVIPPLLRLVPWGAMTLVRRFTEARLHSPHALPEDLQQFHERSKQIGKAGYIRRIEILRSYDVRDRLREIAVPTLFLAGDRDELIPSEAQARFMAARMPRAQLQVLRGYGHICLINHDLDLLDYIDPWLEAEVASQLDAPDVPADALEAPENQKETTCLAPSA